MSSQPPPQPPMQPQQPGYGAPPPAQSGTNGLAIASFILSIVWLCWLGSVLGVIFGHVALSQIKKTGDVQGGKGLAVAGVIIGYVGIAFLIFTIFVGSWEFSVG